MTLTVHASPTILLCVGVAILLLLLVGTRRRR
jgi:hypothetical protein